jgi:hypothetical protein
MRFVRGIGRTVAEAAICAVVPPTKHASVTAWCYARAGRDYRPGAQPFEAGLHDWEAAVLGAPPFPRTGRLLLGGAGGGRELKALIERDFEVTAFEPSSLWRSALEVGGTRATVLQGSYADLVRAVAGRGGPLQNLANDRFDAIVLGWGSLPHVTDPDERRELFAALRRLGPSAPVLLSFQLQSVDPPMRRLSDPLHRALRRLHAPGEPCPTGLRFTRRAGFIYRFSRDELETLAAETGYAVARFSPQWYSYAVWVPQSL